MTFSIHHIGTIQTEKRMKYHKYLPVKIDGVSCDALVDSGNTWRSVISVGFMKALGLTTDQLLPPPASTINTGKGGSTARGGWESRLGRSTSDGWGHRGSGISALLSSETYPCQSSSVAPS